LREGSRLKNVFAGSRRNTDVAPRW